MKPNLIEAGDICLAYEEGLTYEDDEGTAEPVKFALLIQCENAEQVREAMRTGRVSFTVFGAEKEGGAA